MTSRSNESAASAAGPAGGAATLICWAVAARAPSSSATVSVIVYSPAVAYVCDAVGPVAVAPSPKSHANDATVPSGSVEAAPSTATVSASVAVQPKASVAVTA